MAQCLINGCLTLKWHFSMINKLINGYLDSHHAQIEND